MESTANCNDKRQKGSDAPQHYFARSNKELNPTEKLAKRNLKKILKQKQRIKKYQIRYQQAAGRGDVGITERAEKELDAYYDHLSKDSTSLMYQPGFQRINLQQSVYAQPEQEPLHIQEGRRWMWRLWNQLILQIKDPTTTKEEQTVIAQKLLINMTKGTQTESMFDNDQALLGYTRQKFNERVMLAYTSLDRARKYPDLFNRLLKTRQIGSIGCGPGCEAVGALCFLILGENPQDVQRLQDANFGPSRRAVVDRIVLMDYVMPQWKRLVVDYLIPLISPHYVSQVSSHSADVRLPFGRGMNEGLGKNDVDFAGLDLVMVSYLLTETRGNWKEFFGDVLKKLKSGTLLLLSEPTAWQLHSFLQHYADFIASHQWLDSSQDDPELQPLEARMGPAVVLITVK